MSTNGLRGRRRGSTYTKERSAAESRPSVLTTPRDVDAPAPANKMAEQVGPEFYDTAGVMAVLAQQGMDPISKQAVEHRFTCRSILALQTTPTADLEGLTAIQWLDKGRDRERLLRVARRTAHRWAA